MGKINFPSKLIYEAWLNTPEPIIYKTSANKKQIIFANPINNKYFDPAFSGKCNLCGEEATGGVPVKKFFSSNYMDWGFHRCPESTHICKACTFCLGMNTVGRIALFRYPLVVETHELHLCSKKQFRDFILQPPEPPFLMILPVSQQKHLFAKSRISYSRKKFFCNFEERIVNCSDETGKLVKSIEKMREMGIGIDNIEKCVIPASIIKKTNIKEQEALLQEMELNRSKPAFELALKVSLAPEKKGD